MNGLKVIKKIHIRDSLKKQLDEQKASIKKEDRKKYKAALFYYDTFLNNLDNYGCITR